MALRHSLALLGSVLACAPHPPELTDTILPFEYLSYPPPAGVVATPTDHIVAISPSGQWLAVCRGETERVAQLLVGDALAVDIDYLHAVDPIGRHVVFDRAGKRYLYDTVRQLELELGPAAALTHGSFDYSGEAVAYGVRSEDPEGTDTIVVRTLATGDVRQLASPQRPVTSVELASTTDHLWISTNSRPPATLGGNMCNVGRGCFLDRAEHRTTHALVDLRHADPTFIDLDHDPRPHVAVNGAAVVQSDAGVELVRNDARTSIAPAGCDVEREIVPGYELLIACAEPDETPRYSIWNPGGLTPLAFVPARENGYGYGFGTSYLDRGVIRGAEGSWLSLPTKKIVQGYADQTQAHAWEDRMVLVGPTVQIFDVHAGGTLIAEHEISGHLEQARGPHVAITTRTIDRDNGWVVDLRDGSLRPFVGPMTALSRSGHVMVREPDGVHWR